MSLDSEQSKWICEYCTYENFPSSFKCTMCRHPNPSRTSEDIYKLRDESPDTDNDHVESFALVKKNVWYCDICKQENNINSKECMQCKSARYSPTGVQDQFNALEIGENEIDTIASEQQKCEDKWSCLVCTYENWPRAKKCIMCMQHRSKVSPVSSTMSINSPERELASNTRNSEENYIRKRGNSRWNDELRSSSSNNIEERRLRSQRKIQRNTDRCWLNACMGIYKGDPAPVIVYLSSGGDPTRQLTHNEVTILNKPSVFDAGYTLVHLAIRFKRDDLLATLLSQIEGSSSGIKRVPSYVAPDLAADIRRHFASIIRQRNSSFACPFVNEHTTFYLPAEIDDLPVIVQEQLFEEILDKDVQQQLETHLPPIINWSRMASRLYALWNRSAGDCLLDSVMQVTWGVFDRENILRHALADALTNCGRMFYPRWREYESIQATMLDFSLEETQWEEDWAALVSLATQPGSSLEQLHVFALAHILRCPIIIYGVKNVKSFRGEDIGYARFEGVYLPLLWEPSFCSKSPLILGYTRGHFSALVPGETDLGPAHLMSDSHSRVSFLPLMDYNHQLLPVHFATQTEMEHEERLLRQWMDVFVTDSGLLIAQQKLQKRPLLVAQMLEEWLNYYRRLAQMSIAPFRRPIPLQDYSSEGETDDE